MDQSTDKGGPGNSSTRPYLIRALHDWCTDNGFTPYIAVHVDRLVQVPMEYVSNNEIVLNVGFDATSGLDLGNEFIQFKARFGGTAREIIVPVDHVVAIYARENGQGMASPRQKRPMLLRPWPVLRLRLQQTHRSPRVACAWPLCRPLLPRLSTSRLRPNRLLNRLLQRLNLPLQLRR